ncbi:MAG: VanZ family protein [Euryarchaeota archaeon]|nr:VanZ family protein [Euryarchaeota archaeon]
MMKGVGSRKFVVCLTLTILYAALIFYLSSQSHLPQAASEMKDLLHKIISIIGVRYFHTFKSIISHPDKLEHFMLFFGFGILLRLTAYHSRYPSIRENAMLVTLMVGIGYGALDEVHQMLVPYRSPSIYDFVADAAGIVCAQIFIALVMWVYMYVRLQNARNR